MAKNGLPLLDDVIKKINKLLKKPVSNTYLRRKIDPDQTVYSKEPDVKNRVINISRLKNNNIEEPKSILRNYKNNNIEKTKSILKKDKSKSKSKKKTVSFAKELNNDNTIILPKEEINNGTKGTNKKRLSRLEQALKDNGLSKYQLETISPNNNPKECFIEEETEEAGIIEPQFIEKSESVYEVVKKLDNELIDPKNILTISNPLCVYENSKISVPNNETYKPAVYIEPINPSKYSAPVKEPNPIIANINNIITPGDKKINNDYINNIIPLVDEKINNEINNDCLLFFGLDPIKHNRDCKILLQFYNNKDIIFAKKYSDSLLILNDQKSTDEQDKISLIKKEDIIEYLQNIKHITKKIIRHTAINKNTETSHTVNTKKTEIIHLTQDTMSDTLKNMIKFPKKFLKTDSGINLYTETLKSEFIDYLKKQEQCYTNSY